MLRALKREGESGKRERKGRAFFFFFSRRRRRFASNSNRALRARFDRFLLCSPKDAFLFLIFGVCFLMMSTKIGRKSGRQGFFSLYAYSFGADGFTHSFFLPHPFLNAVQLRCTNDARPGMGERFLLQERRSGSRAEMANVDGPSVDWPRRHDVALEKSRDEATDARPRLVVGIRVTDHGHAKRCVQAGTVGRERRVLRWHGFVDC